MPAEYLTTYGEPIVKRYMYVIIYTRPACTVIVPALIIALFCRIGLDGMKMQVHTCTCDQYQLGRYNYIINLMHPQGTNGSQLWDSAFATQAFIEVSFFYTTRSAHFCSLLIAWSKKEAV